jgi:hypothetical protein
MNPLDILWLSAQAAAFVMLLIVTLIFVRQQGRTKVYLSALLGTFTLHALASVVTAFQNEIAAGWAFKVPRTTTWSLIAIAGLCMVLYQLGVINGLKKN